MGGKKDSKLQKEMSLSKLENVKQKTKIELGID